MWLQKGMKKLEVNPLPNNKILDQSKLKGFADDKVNVIQNQKFVLERVKKHSGKRKNIVGKGENAGYQHFSPLPTMFSKGFFFKVVKSRDTVVESYIHFPDKHITDFTIVPDMNKVCRIH